MSSEKLFLLGVGCQKGGTTWLHDQLSKSNNFDGGLFKEYHVFDCLHIEPCINIKEPLIQRLKEINNLNISSPNTLGILMHNLFFSNPDSYFDYFDYLWLSKKSTKIVGDITPSYCGLDSIVFQTIRKKLEERGFRVKIVFLMRDPVERIHSMFRMKKRDLSKSNEISSEIIKISEDEFMKKKYKEVNVEFRTRYDKTILNLESAFDEENIFYSLYEDLFSDECISRLSKFLEIDSKIFDKSQFSNVSPRKEFLREETTALVANYYSEVYSFVEKRFDISTKWKSHKYISRSNLK